MNNIRTDESVLLVVEDDEGLQRQLRWCLDNYSIIFANNRNEAVAAINKYHPQVMTLDLGLPPDPENVTEGFATLASALETDPDLKIIVITGNDERESALRAIANGAYDFYQKPIEPDILKIILSRAYKLSAIERENRGLQQNANKSALDGLITSDSKMLAICRTIEKVAPTDASTLLIGESGTGKEILANALHALSNRSKQKFIAINCAAIPENLLESELFGYEKGAFTGAAKQTIGKVELADGGTLFLDEIGDLPLSLQAKLLRFLQEKMIERVGGRKEIPVDVRIVCATHRDLKEMITKGAFRQDLYFRLSEINIFIPPLRDRGVDSIVLAKAFLENYKQLYKKKIIGFTEEALSDIERYSWTGNVRELSSKIKSVVLLCDNPYITPEDLSLFSEYDSEIPKTLKYYRDRAEYSAIQRALNMTNGNISKAADVLDISRPVLYDLIKKHKIRE